MAKIKIPYLVAKPYRPACPRYYWQPSARLAAAGWQLTPLGTDQVAAIARARAINAGVEAWRRGQAPADPTIAAPAPRAAGKAPAAGTVDALVLAFKASRFWKQLEPRTQRGYDQCLDIIREWAGDAPAAAITAARAEKLYAPLQVRAPAMANAVMRVGRLLWNRAAKVGVPVGVNPFEKPGLVGLDKNGKPWPRAAIAAMVDAADRLGMHGVGDAIALNEWLGQRQADILALPRTILSAEDLPIRQGKGGVWVVLPLSLVPQIAARLALMRARTAGTTVKATTAIVNAATGLPYNEHTFRHDVARVRAAIAAGDEAHGIAACPTWSTDYVIRGRERDGGSPRSAGADAFTLRTGELVFKDLRHTAVLALSEAGVSDVLISAVTGHTLGSVKQILETYLVRTKAMAVEAFKRRLAHEGRDQPATPAHEDNA